MTSVYSLYKSDLKKLYKEGKGSALGFLKRQHRFLLLFRIATSGHQVLAKVARWWLANRFTVVVGPDVMVGDGFSCPHPYGVIIGDSVRIGSDVVIGQFVTVGGNMGRERDGVSGRFKTPIIGNRVRISAGAVIAGPVCVGDGALIGANAVVTRDVDANALIRR